MPRSFDETRRRAKRYGLRHRVLEQLEEELRSSTVPPSTVRRLLADVKRFRNDRRRQNAIWAMVDALEAVDSRGSP